MTGEAKQPDPQSAGPDDNAEQDEAGTQAQDVAADALGKNAQGRESVESEHGGKRDPAEIIPQDMQDLVDHMKDMERSGRIDMDAFEGEPESMDDEDGSLPE